MGIISDDNRYMKIALEEALRAFGKGEIPVGAIITGGGRVIARCHNLTETLGDPTAHAEMQAITAATSWMGGKYLSECTLYVTLEPCVMCAGALYWSRMGTVVYGCSDPKRGYSTVNEKILHPKTQVRKNVMADECSALLNRFFNARRL